MLIVPHIPYFQSPLSTNPNKLRQVHVWSAPDPYTGMSISKSICVWGTKECWLRRWAFSCVMMRSLYSRQRRDATKQWNVWLKLQSIFKMNSGGQGLIGEVWMGLELSSCWFMQHQSDSSRETLKRDAVSPYYTIAPLIGYTPAFFSRWEIRDSLGLW